MIRRLAAAGALLWAGSARAEDPPADDVPAEDPAEAPAGDQEEPPPEPVDVLSRHRTPFDVLADRAIGTTSVPVEFNWRRSSIQLAGASSFLFELNNFNSVRGGALARIPTGGTLLELGLSYVSVWNTPSSGQLALTPYRQPGRPDRLELDVALVVPLAEGVVTASPKLFPAVQLVFNAYGGVRYLIHPTGFARMTAGQVAGAILAPTLTEAEIANLEDDRLAAMQVDPARYGLMFGLGNDVYFEPGLFVSPRLLLAVPLLAPATRTDLLWWADFTIAVGVAL